jgi:hypothetical protein
MAIKCTNGSKHSHETVDEVRACYGQTRQAQEARMDEAIENQP